jgi:hypothetical protein
MDNSKLFEHPQSKNIFNNFRWDTALSYQVNGTLRIELHYILQTSDIFSRSDLRVVENIFRLRVFKKL